MAGLHLAKRYLVASDSEPHAPPDTSVCDARRLALEVRFRERCLPMAPKLLIAKKRSGRRVSVL
jgi:hypothetical protein